MNRLIQILRQNRVPVTLLAVFLALGVFILWSALVPGSDRRLEAIRKSGYPVTLAKTRAQSRRLRAASTPMSSPTPKAIPMA